MVEGSFFWLCELVVYNITYDCDVGILKMYTLQYYAQYNLAILLYAEFKLIFTCILIYLLHIFLVDIDDDGLNIFSCLILCHVLFLRWR